MSKLIFVLLPSYSLFFLYCHRLTFLPLGFASTMKSCRLSWCGLSKLRPSLVSCCEGLRSDRHFFLQHFRLSFCNATSYCSTLTLPFHTRTHTNKCTLVLHTYRYRGLEMVFLFGVSKPCMTLHVMQLVCMNPGLRKPRRKVQQMPPTLSLVTAQYTVIMLILTWPDLELGERKREGELNSMLQTLLCIS